MKKDERPYIILSAAMTIDGKIASITGDPELSDQADWREVHKLRTQVDAIMVGKGTIMKDDPKLHIKFHEHIGYTRIVIDSNLSIPIDSNVITFESKTYPTTICIVEKADSERIKNFEALGVKVLKCGNGERVDVKKALTLLHSQGIKSILLEGGGTLNWSFIRENLIDEMRITIAPWIVGGKEATSLVEGLGFEKMSQAPRFNLIETISRNNYVVLKYKRME